ncbi:sugar kinase [Saccharothrix luteola]|uniref:sugar kinase n=1 Tax=Saccharothrix luteola TaxID=2893018 RepID=UPI001E37FFFE|nr:sugar kinase [Saccharothrix luteola]MCC8242915.1 sugar kinase [Saccharothrix luteola]
MIDVVVLGETMMSLRSTGTWRSGATATTSIAGAESTVAIGLSRLGHSARWVGRVGNDEPGELVLRTLRAEGVDTSAVARDEGAPTGLILFEQRTPDVTRVIYHRSGSAGSRLTEQDALTGLTGGTRLLHVTGITPALGPGPLAAAHAAVDHVLDQGGLVSFDVNYRSRLWSADEASRVLTPLARRASVLIGSPEEIDLVGGDHAAGHVVTKLGADGARVRVDGGTWSAPAHRVRAVDPVGAGDAFTAGYLSGLLDGLPPAECLARGNTTGAFAVMTTGDWEGLPSRSELSLLDLAGGSTLR